MTLCINPNCAQPNHTDNDTQAHCPTCGAELIIKGRYRVMRLLTDTSGFGVVYEAFERDQPKILKLLKPCHSQHPKAVQLFEQEALVLSRLQHPGVPSIAPDGCFQIIPTPGANPLHCIIMEKIDGPNLSEWMRQQGNHPISEHQALHWLQQLAEVLHLVHQQQYFHRDIKPDNIMLRSNGQLVLVDFGAVREVSYAYFEQLDSTGGITRISSVGYTAPEQERGKAVPQSDFYSLGCTFIYLLTGKKPLAPDIYDSLTNEFHWRSFAPHISSGLADFIDRLTAARVIDRPPNTLEILAKIGELQTTLSRDRQGQQNHISMQSIGEFTADQSMQAGSSHTSSPSSPMSAGPSDNALPPASSGMDLDLDNTATLPPDHTFIGSIAPLSSAPSSSIPASSSETSSGASPSSASLPSSVPVPPLGGRNEATDRPSPEEGEPNPTTMQPSDTLLQDTSKRFPILWKPWAVAMLLLLGGTAVFWGGRSLYLSHLETLEQPASLASPALSFRSTSRLEGHTSAVNALAMSLDQKMLVSASDDRTIRLWDLVAGQEIRKLVGHRDRVQAVAISPNGQIIASGGGDNLIKLWNPLTGEAIANLTGHSGPINDLVITADGQRLASASADKTIKVWDLGTYEELITLEGHNSFVNTLDISPDGTVLASGSADRTIKLWNLSTYQDIATLSGHDSFINTLVFSLNGNTLISGGADHHIKIWDDKTYEQTDEQTYEPIHSLEQHTSFVNALAITFDGQYLVSTSADQSIRVWDLSSQTSLTTIPWKNTFVNTVVIRFSGSTWQILAGGQGSDSIQIWNLEERPL